MYYAVTENSPRWSGTKLRIFEDWEDALNHFSERADIALEVSCNLRPISDKKGRTVGLIDTRGYNELRIIKKLASKYTLHGIQEIQVDLDGHWFFSKYTVHVEEGMALSAKVGTWGIEIMKAKEAQPTEHWQNPEHWPGLISWMAHQNMFKGSNIIDAWNVAASKHIERLKP